jgi:hypothetical protein
MTVAEAWAQSPNSIYPEAVSAIKDIVSMFGIESLSTFPFGDAAPSLGHAFIAWLRQIPGKFLDGRTLDALMGVSEPHHPTAASKYVEAQIRQALEISGASDENSLAPLAFVAEYLAEIKATPVDSSTVAQEVYIF